MSDAYVNLEVAKAIAAWYPQAGLQMRYTQLLSGLWVSGLKLEYPGAKGQRLAAPTPLQVLDWLEKEKGWKWYRSGGLGVYWMADRYPLTEEKLTRDNPNALILAIVSRWKERS